MALIIIDHRDGQNPDGTKGTLLEMDAHSCAHCQALISITLRGLTKEPSSHYRCSRCARPICRFCGEKRAGVCTPFVDVVERALKTQRAFEWSEYHYRSCTRN